MPADTFMELKLAPLPRKKIRSHYKKGDFGFPSRMSFLHPKCAAAFVEMQMAAGWDIVLTDAWRAGAMSRKRKYPKGKPMRRSTKAPAHSGHNYGFSIDIDTAATMKRMKLSKKELDAFMARFGFVCHRKDHRRAIEDWHYNALVLGGGPERWLKESKWRRSTARSVEMMIREAYGDYWSPSTKQKQVYLKFLGMYSGKIDGDFGPKSKAAAREFQRQWHLKVDGVIGKKTSRVLAFRCAELKNAHVKDLWTVRL